MGNNNCNSDTTAQDFSKFEGTDNMAKYLAKLTQNQKKKLRLLVQNKQKYIDDQYPQIQGEGVVLVDAEQVMGKYQIGICKFMYLLDPNFKHSALHLFHRFIFKQQGPFPQKNIYDYYPIELTIDDHNTIITVNSRIPVIKNISFFGKTDTNSIWMYLIEKAWIKVKFGYHLLRDQEELVLALNGHLVYSQKTNIYINFLNGILRSFHQQIRKWGIVPRCLYYVQRQIKINDQVAYRIVNPHGFMKFRKGKYSYNSRHWKEQQRVKYNIPYLQEFDAFVMTPTEITKVFDIVYFAQKIKDYQFNRYNLKAQTCSQYFQFQIFQKQVLAIYLQQQTLYKPQQQKHPFASCIFDLARFLQNNEMKLISQGDRNSYFGNKKIYINESGKIQLQAGKYMIHLKLKPFQQFYRKLNLGIYSRQYIKLKDIPNSQGTILKESYFFNCLASGEKTKWLKHRCLILVKNNSHQTNRYSLIWKPSPTLNMKLQDFQKEGSLQFSLQGKFDRVISFEKINLNKNVQGMDFSIKNL